MLKALKKLGIQGSYLDIIKVLQIYSQHYTKWEESESIFFEIKKKTMESTFTNLIQYSA
jgi:hypothetical protein